MLIIETKSTLYIPMGVKAENEIFQGFGKKELLQSLVGMLIVGVFSFLLFIITRSVPNTMISLLAGVSCSIVATIKDQYNMSIVTQIGHLISFFKGQKKYKYVYGNEWIEL